MAAIDTTAEDRRDFTLICQGGKIRDQGVGSLYRRYAPQFLKFFRYQGLSNADAEDVVQETFLNIVRNCASYRGESPLQAWFWTITRNAMNNHFRRTKARPAENLDDETWEALEQNLEALRVNDPPPGETLEDCVQRGVAEFAKKFAERAYALSLAMEGYDIAYIAAAIERNLGATREFMSQSRKRVEKFLEPCREYLHAG